MSLVYAGIDEAGYGPMLGPLCVACAAFRISRWSPGSPAPDLWALLSSAVCERPRDAHDRVPIADSKVLKLSNQGKRNPVTHLERGVLSLLGTPLPRTDLELFQRIGAVLGPGEWYSGEPETLPAANDARLLAIDANRVAAAMSAACVGLVHIACEIVDEGELNAIIDRTGSKGEATLSAIGAHLRRLTALPGEVRIVCDRLGGRERYAGVLERELPGWSAEPLEESDRVSRYALRPRGRAEARVVIQFLPDSERAHLPVALASMTAKLTRELAMSRFNRYWIGRVPELKPTAGYVTDAQRWLADVADALRPGERAALVRRA